MSSTRGKGFISPMLFAFCCTLRCHACNWRVFFTTVIINENSLVIQSLKLGRHQPAGNFKPAPIVRVASQAYLGRLNIFRDDLAEQLFKVATLLSGSLERKKERPLVTRLISTIERKWPSQNPFFFSLLGLLFEAKNQQRPKFTLWLCLQISPFASADTNRNSCLGLHVCRK